MLTYHLAILSKSGVGQGCRSKRLLAHLLPLNGVFQPSSQSAPLQGLRPDNCHKKYSLIAVFARRWPILRWLSYLLLAMAITQPLRVLVATWVAFPNASNKQTTTIFMPQAHQNQSSRPGNLHRSGAVRSFAVSKAPIVHYLLRDNSTLAGFEHSRMFLTSDLKLLMAWSRQGLD